MRRIILVVESREYAKHIDYFRAIRAGQNCIEAEFCMSLCFNGKTLFESIFLIVFCLRRKCDKEFHFLV